MSYYRERGQGNKAGNGKRRKDKGKGMK